MSRATGNNGAGFGIQTAGIYATGYLSSISTPLVEQYDGTSWTEIADVNRARGGAGASQAGSVTSAVIFGGGPGSGVDAQTESWNGSSWTEVADLNTARQEGGGFGNSSTNAVFAGGASPAPNLAIVESWDGTSWTEVGDLATSRAYLAAGGASSSSGIVFGGTTGSPSNATEEWNVPSSISNVTVASS